MAGDDTRESADTDDRLSPERIEALLTNRRRRYALRCLYARQNPVSLPDVADQVTRWEYDDPVEERLDERLHIYMSLYHDHLPVLEAAGLVRYSQAADAVELTAHATKPGIERAIRAEFDDLSD
ncbi:MAG: hypothetical protein ABEH78_03935 [Haloferacaceae archaeon]